jgi:hypothetical protein
MGNSPPHPAMDIPPDLEAVYSNMVRIAHTPAELVFDFARILPGNSTMRLFARVIMSPVGAKLFYRALAENLARYEATFGEIPLPGEGSLANDLFRSIHPPETPPEA